MGSKGDLFTSIVNQNSPWHLNMAAFINISTWGWQLTSIQATSIFIPSDTGTFCFLAFVHYFCHLISRSSHFSFQCHDYLVNWPVNLSFISYFHKPVSSLSIKLLATKESVLLTKKKKKVTFQSTDNAIGAPMCLRFSEQHKSCFKFRGYPSSQYVALAWLESPVCHIYIYIYIYICYIIKEWFFILIIFH